MTSTRKSVIGKDNTHGKEVMSAGERVHMISAGDSNLNF